MPITFEFASSISKVREYKNELKSANPFEFLDYFYALEQSKSACKETGWTPKHIHSKEKNNINGFIPIYIKDNSYGEFVFDQQWAYALQRANRNYYPKLVTATPFTPCITNKLFSDSHSLKNKMIDMTLDMMEQENIETWHILFPDEESKNIFKEKNFIKRSGYRFVWQNKGYADFDEFLSKFTSRQRKNINNERRSLSKEKIEFFYKDYDNLKNSDWDLFYRFYCVTYHERMQNPYLTRNFFDLVHANKKNLRPILFFAKKNNEIIAASLCFESDKTLYGRHWGSTSHIKNLHFETCYYQGIEYCIQKGIEIFDPGIQGEYKIRRGFEPIECNSFHFIKSDDFREAIKSFCNQETVNIKNYIESCKKYTPFKKTDRIIK